MSTEPSPSTESLLQRVVEHAPLQARAALLDSRPLDAVVWASAHLAAAERVVLPVATRVLPEGDALTVVPRGLAARIQDALRTLERLHSGDALVARVDGARLRRVALVLLDEYVRAERRLLSQLSAALPPDEQHSLASSYRRALEHAPTRPHPHAPRAGALGRLAFRLDALRDRVMDVMDARHVPAPRAPREPVRVGAWGWWLLGQPRPDRRAG